MPDRPSDDNEKKDNPPEAPMQRMNVGDIQKQLDALDDEKDRQQPRDGRGYLDMSQARQALSEMRERAQHHGPGSNHAAIRGRADALDNLQRVVEQKLNCDRQPQVLAQGLRRLFQTVYCEPQFEQPSGVDEKFQASIDEFDRAYRQLQKKASDLLKKEVGLTIMPDQAGNAIDPRRHDVIDSRAAPNTASGDTVATQHAPGWLLEGDVLVKAEVVRYATGDTDASGLSDVDELQSPHPDDDITGRKRENREG